MSEDLKNVLKITKTTLKPLIDKNVIAIEEEVAYRGLSDIPISATPNQLTDHQKEAFDKIAYMLDNPM